MDRRVQILLDGRRYDLLEREAARRETSVAALIRAAIDRTYAGDDANRREAGRRLLAAPPMPVEDWEQMKAQMLDEMSGG
ncbi:MAG: antitoxin [Euzebyaceae bacterium]|nr:antitoxin [Euzebyaceae bacterium]